MNKKGIQKAMYAWKVKIKIKLDTYVGTTVNIMSYKIV